MSDIDLTRIRKQLSVCHDANPNDHPMFGTYFWDVSALLAERDDLIVRIAELQATIADMLSRHQQALLAMERELERSRSFEQNSFGFANDMLGEANAAASLAEQAMRVGLEECERLRELVVRARQSWESSHDECKEYHAVLGTQLARANAVVGAARIFVSPAARRGTSSHPAWVRDLCEALAAYDAGEKGQP